MTKLSCIEFLSFVSGYAKNNFIILLKDHESLLTNPCVFGQHSKCCVMDEVTEYHGAIELGDETDCRVFGPATLRDTS